MPWRRFIVAVVVGAALSAVVLAYTANGLIAAWQEVVAKVLPTRFGDIVFDVLVIIPVLFLLCLPGLLLACWIMSRRRRTDDTRCRACGYILRGITEPRCPECGEAI